MPKRYPNDRRAITGAANELRVAADLMMRGYTVFRALDGRASCDLIALEDNPAKFPIRVQVRTGQVSKSGRVTVGRHGTHDLLAIVAGGAILYEGYPIKHSVSKEGDEE